MRRTHRSMGWGWHLAGLFALCGGPSLGCGEDQPPPRPRPPAVDFQWVDGLPGGLSPAPARALYLVHSPASSSVASPFAEIAFATTDTGYELHAVSTGPITEDEGQWLRFGVVQDLAVSPLGERYLVGEGAVERIRVHGQVGGAWYAGESTDVSVEADLSSGALHGRFSVDIESADGPPHTLVGHFSGQLERECVRWIYQPGLEPTDESATGGACDAIMRAIDAEETLSDGPELPPGFISLRVEAAE